MRQKERALLKKKKRTLFLVPKKSARFCKKKAHALFRRSLECQKKRTLFLAPKKSAAIFRRFFFGKHKKSGSKAILTFWIPYLERF